MVTFEVITDYFYSTPGSSWKFHLFYSYEVNKWGIIQHGYQEFENIKQFLKISDEDAIILRLKYG